MEVEIPLIVRSNISYPRQHIQPTTPTMNHHHRPSRMASLRGSARSSTSEKSR